MRALHWQRGWKLSVNPWHSMFCQVREGQSSKIRILVFGILWAFSICLFRRSTWIFTLYSRKFFTIDGKIEDISTNKKNILLLNMGKISILNRFRKRQMMAINFVYLIWLNYLIRHNWLRRIIVSKLWKIQYEIAIDWHLNENIFYQWSKTAEKHWQTHCT